MNVAKAHFLQRLQLAQNFIMVRKERYRFIDGHIQHIGNIFPLVPHFQGFAIVAGAVAHFAGHIDIGQKLHFDLDDAIAVASLAAAAFDIEAETPRLVASHLRLGGLAVELADVIENAGIGGRVRPRRAADGLLVDVNDLIHILHAFHGVVLPGAVGSVIFDIAKALVKDFIHKGTFAGAGLSRHHREGAQRDGHIDMLQIVFRSPFDGEEKSISFSTLRRQRDVFLAAKVHAGDGVLHVLHIFRCALCHHVASIFAGAGADVYHPVSGADGVLVMLHHDQRISQVPHAFQGSKKLVIISLVQADGRLVQDVEHPHQAAADLGSQADALRLTAGQGGRAAGQGQVIQAHIHQE